MKQPLCICWGFSLLAMLFGLSLHAQPSQETAGSAVPKVYHASWQVATMELNARRQPITASELISV